MTRPWLYFFFPGACLDQQTCQDAPHSSTRCRRVVGIAWESIIGDFSKADCQDSMCPKRPTMLLVGNAVRVDSNRMRPTRHYKSSPVLWDLNERGEQTSGLPSSGYIGMCAIRVARYIHIVCTLSSQIPDSNLAE
jgi:hypothetical protein